jgi:PAS domain S-box-containing protein
MRAHLAAIVDSSDDAILSKNLDGIILSCNAAAERIFGYRASELIGRPVTTLIPPERITEEDEILARIRRGVRIDHFETVRVAKDGTRLDVSLTISPIRDASGTIIGASKIARDITERKRAAAALAAQQEWFRVTLASIGDGVIASNADGIVTYLNPVAEKLTGWSVRDAAGKPLTEVFDIIDEKTRTRMHNPAELVIRHGKIVGLANHTVLISKNGTESPIADSAAPILDDHGRILGVVLVFRDVLEERLAQEALAEQREWLETTLASIGDAVIATDVRGQIVFMNAVAENLTGWPANVARGRPCSDVFRILNEKTREIVESPVTRVLSEGMVVGLANHTILVSADGTERPIDDSGAPIRNHAGRIVGVVLVFRDVTERRRAELDRHAVALDRERLLEAERLARAEAERASRIKDDFVAVISHELRTPLNAIYGWTELMARKPTDPAMIQRGLEVVARNVRLQSRLISDLLDISRIVSGKLKLEFQRVDPATIIEDAIDTVQQDASAKGIEIERRLGVVEPIAADPARLQQSVWNLLSNAVKFTPAGGRVTVGLEQCDGHVEITVQDTGIGIERHVLPHVFDRFHQGDGSINRRFGGLGLGLSIVKHLVALHGGSVKADSPGQDMGAKFTLSFPTSVAAPADHDSVRPTAGRVAAEEVALNGLRVLVVEDEPDTAEFVKHLLRDHGAEVWVATSGAEGLRILATERPQVLISDISMPEMDGYELMQRIRKKDERDGGAILAVALTAFARTDDRMRALRAGYQAHLAKPVEPAELLATVANFAELNAVRRK